MKKRKKQTIRAEKREQHKRIGKKETMKLSAPEITNHHFIPFIVRMWRGQKEQGSGSILPLDQPEALTAEAVVVVKEVISRGCFQALFSQIGWQAMPVCQAGQEKPQRLRLFELPMFASHPLRFTHHSFDLLLFAYNLSRTPPHWTDSEPSLTQQRAILQQSKERLRQYIPDTSGDLLLHHLLTPALLKLKTDPDLQARLLLQNPLNILNELFGLPLPTPPLAPFERLFQDDLRFFLPWLSILWLRRWLAQEHQRWSLNLERFLQFNRLQGEILHQWIDAAERFEAYDTLPALFSYYTRLLQTSTAPQHWVDALLALLRPLRLQERQPHIEAWLRVLTPARRLHNLYQACLARHPIDREATHKILMETYQQHSFQTTIRAYDSHILTLQPRLG